MVDPRMTRLANVLINYSTAVKPGERILIEAIDVPHEITNEVVRVAREAGADPLVTLKSNIVLRQLLIHGSEAQLRLIAEAEALRMKGVQAYIGLRGNQNITEMSDVPADKMKLYQTIWWKPVHGEIRVRRTRWVVLRYPSPAMAQQAQMSTEAFERFYFDVCTLDYGKMAAAMQPLVARMKATDRVKILGPETELHFSIKNLPAIGCAGKLNIPDGEAFTAPVRDSVNGTIKYNARTLYQGVVHEDIRLEFRNGKVIHARSSNTDHLNTVLNTDDGSSYVGEFALGFNPYITRPMLDTLFDEKIAGSFHFTPGSAYEDEADNGNRSAVHWDMVCIQTPECGGGEIWFDNELLRKDGRFVPPDLQPLNPENLK